jgi:hypothetical protein
VIVQAIKSEARCKLCKNPARAEIDQLLLKRSLRERNESGEPINLAYVLRALAHDYSVANPTEENVKGHWKNHCRTVSEQDAEAQEADFEEQYEKYLRGEFEFEDVDDGLRFLWSMYVREQKQKAAKGESLGLTHDHGIKFADSMTKRKSAEATQELLGALGGAIAASAQRQIEGAPAALPEAAEDAEFEEVQE